jgi:hypothetical protein
MVANLRRAAPTVQAISVGGRDMSFNVQECDYWCTLVLRRVRFAVHLGHQRHNAMNNTLINGKEKIGNRGYFVYYMGSMFFAIYSYGDGDVLFLSKPYRTAKGADKKLTEYRKQANE